MKDFDKSPDNELKISPLRFSGSFRVPISNLLNDMKILANYLNRKGIKEYANLVDEALKDLYLLLRNVTQIESCHLEGNLIPTQTNITDFFETFCLKITGLLEEKGFIFTYKTLEESVYADVDIKYLEISLLNIISNSCIYADKEDEHSKNISAALSVENDFINISITDNSGGVDVDILKKSSADYRADSQPFTEYYGIGAGLYIVESIANMHNGKMEIKSNKSNKTNKTKKSKKSNNGTTITISIPILRNPKINFFNDNSPEMVRREISNNMSAYIKSIDPHKK